MEENNSLEQQEQKVTENESSKGQEERKFTDADMARTRRAFESQKQQAEKKAAEKALKEFVSSLGLESSEELLSLVDKARGVDVVASEKNKLEGSLKRIQQERDELANSLKVLEKKQRDATIKDEVFNLAKKMNAHEFDVYARLSLHGLEIDNEGKVITQNGEDLEKTIKGLIKDNPHLLKVAQVVGAGSQPTTQQKQAQPDYRDKNERFKILEKIFKTQ